MHPVSYTSRLLTIAVLLALAACQGQTGADQRPEAEATSQPASKRPGTEMQDSANIAQANTRFAFELYNLLAEEGEQNLFFSPYSIYTALAMTLDGARAETATQMQHVLHVPMTDAQPWSNQRFHKAASELVQHFNDADRPYELHAANALWGERQMSFRNDFLTTLQQYYEANLHPMNFTREPEPSRAEINEWIEQQTQGRIENLLPQGTIDRDTRLVLTNAIYFKAAWAMPFQERQTQDREFHLADGTTIDVPTMRQDNLRIGLYEGESFQAIELPYEEQELSMLILLPEAANGLSALAEQLDAQQLDHIVESLKRVQAQVDLPKFNFESDFSLNNALQSLGMPLAFTREADFTGMSDDAEAERLHISDAVHKAFIDVDEEGTEAAAATGIVAGVVSMPVEMPHVQVDRPFLFLIRDTDTQTVLFVGQVSDPR